MGRPCTSEPLSYKQKLMQCKKQHELFNKRQTCGCATADEACSASTDVSCLCSAARDSAVAWPGSSGGGLLLKCPVVEPPSCSPPPTSPRAACDSSSWWGGLLVAPGASFCSRQAWLDGHKHLAGCPRLFLLQPGQSSLYHMHTSVSHSKTVKVRFSLGTTSTDASHILTHQVWLHYLTCVASAKFDHTTASL